MMASLNRDYRVSPEDMLAAAEGKKIKLAPLTGTFCLSNVKAINSWLKLPASDIDRIVLEMMNRGTDSPAVTLL
jgi:hypothetical protein